MIIMPKGSEELTNARKEEIINACASLYETVSFKDITIRDIGAATSFSRTSIYNYFQTKEEIFLALLQREHELWIADLEELIRKNASMSAEAFAGEMAHILEKRRCMLKLMAVNIYDMEGNSRLENLVAFKKAYGASFDAQVPCALFPIHGRGRDPGVSVCILPVPVRGAPVYFAHGETAGSHETGRDRDQREHGV